MGFRKDPVTKFNGVSLNLIRKFACQIGSLCTLGLRDGSFLCSLNTATFIATPIPHPYISLNLMLTKYSQKVHQTFAKSLLLH